MLILSPDEAKAGMKLAAAVQHPDQPDQELLRPGYELEDEVIQRLRRLGVAFIFVEYPALDDLDRHLAAFLSPARQKLYSQMKLTIETSQRRTSPAVSYNEYYSATRELMTTLLSQGQHPIFLDQMARLGNDGVGHAMAVAHLSLLLGIKLENYLIEERRRLPCSRAKDVVNLGVAGMLHDIGKYQLPEALWNLDQIAPPTDPDALEQWQGHPRLSYEQIREAVEPTAASAVLQHHQRFDGSGFPSISADGAEAKRLSERRIHIFARILLAADLYDRLATGHPRRKSNVEVLHLLRTKYASWIDPVVLRGLCAVAPPFPPGCRLRLSDGTSAIVLRVDEIDPYSPVVRRIAEEDWQMAGEQIDLSLPGTPQILSVGETKVKGLVPA
ncbi:MAG: HD domain-containing protein [Anaerolineae bacterium]|nr:HD domain-containing protein [Phycisphaerae bacterium]